MVTNPSGTGRGCRITTGVSMLHILNGDCTAHPFSAAGLPGSHITWREVMIMGPTPDGNDWPRIRARYLAETHQLDEAECRADMEGMQHALWTSLDQDEVVLWFEDDLFCYVNLLYLIQWYERRGASVRLGLVCGPQRLGRSTPDELAAMFPTRRQLDARARQLARAAWDAYAADTPGPAADLLVQLRRDPALAADLPFLPTALMLHLARLPSATSGLGRVQRRALELIASGHERFGDAFRAFVESEPDYGLGDCQLATEIESLIAAGLVSASEPFTAQRAGDASLSATDLGRAALAGRDVAAVLPARPLGGMGPEATSGRWRWDEAAEQVVERRAAAM